jgi:TatD DNase family protein
MAERFDNLYATVGVHPNEAATFRDEAIAELEGLYRHPKVVGIGEIGLDYHWDFASKEQQFIALRAQVALAKSISAPIVFHCREAYEDLLNFVEQESLSNTLLHCFGGTPDDHRRALKLGAMLGVDGPVTYPKADGVRALVAATPHDRLLLETDAPWMSPHPFRGRPNTPSRLTYIRDAVAKVWEMDPTAVTERTTSNARRFFKID